MHMRAAIVIVLLSSACTSGDDRGTTSFGSGMSTTATTMPATDGDTSSGTTAAATSAESSTTLDPATSTTMTSDPATSSPTDATTDTGEVACPALGGQDCSPGTGSGENDTCVDGTPCYLDLVQQGVQAVIAAHPEWFDAIDPTLVLDAESYMDAVVAEVGAQGVCAIRDPNAGDEMAVKHDDAFAESYDILSADGHARYGELIYTATCSPSWF
jgi:hypothetical protein